MSVRNDARAAQFAGLPEDMVERVGKVYDLSDALSEPQKRVLIHEALGMTHSLFRQLANGGGLDGACLLGAGLVALAGYANETIRDDLGETSTGDKAVDEVIESFRQAVAHMATAGMDPERVEGLKNVAARAAERMAKGEDYDAALRAEYDAWRAANPAPEESVKGEVVAAADDGYGGLYL